MPQLGHCRRGASISLLKGHVGIAPVRERNFGQLGAAVRLAYDRVAEIEAFESALDAGGVVTPPGWREAYQAFIEAGWNGLVFDPAWGGQGLPWLVNAAVQEMWHAANMSFGLCPMLTQGAIEAILFHGSDEQKRLYLPKLVTGEWTGTMCLTEPQAGSDLSAVKMRAVPRSGHYLL